MARPGLTQHRKFRRLARLLGSAILARGVLELLWEPCYEAGDDYLGNAADIEALVGWTGEAGALARALVDAGAPEGHGFIEIVTFDDVPTYRVHDLWHHAPDYVRKRREREHARRKRVNPSAERRRTAPRGAGRTASPISQTEVVRTPAPAPAPAPSPAPARAHTDRARATPADRLAYTEDFEAFWKRYPKKVNKPEALSEWKKLKPDAALVATIHSALDWQLKQPDWTREGGRFVLHPERWLKRRRFEDEPTGLTLVPPTMDWYDECREVHGGSCGSGFKHENQMAIDAGRREKAQAQA